jgi:hypothetical protein
MCAVAAVTQADRTPLAANDAQRMSRAHNVSVERALTGRL